MNATATETTASCYACQWDLRSHQHTCQPAVSTPVHLRPSSCYVCGSAEAHADTTATGGHRYWPNSEAEAELAAEARRHTPRGYSREAAYVAQHRPY